MQPVLSAAIRSNTGDGLRMAQAAGASLWHMWHYHGSYGFRHPDPDYPFGVRLKRLPDWTPGHALRNDVTMTWILVDRSGNRFMNEYEPYMQDTGHRALEPMDFAAQRPARLPAVLIVDSAARHLYPAVGADLERRSGRGAFRRRVAAHDGRGDPCALRHAGRSRACIRD